MILFDAYLNRHSQRAFWRNFKKIDKEFRDQTYLKDSIIQSTLSVIFVSNVCILASDFQQSIKLKHPNDSIPILHSFWSPWMKMIDYQLRHIQTNFQAIQNYSWLFPTRLWNVGSFEFNQKVIYNNLLIKNALVIWFKFFIVI